MATSGRGRPPRVAVEFDEDVWSQEVERLRPRTRMRATAERARADIAARGAAGSELLACRASSNDGTRLLRCLKVYLPLGDRPPSERPYAFVFELPERPDGVVVLRLLAFGERHPPAGTRSVYERAHKRLHGRYPDQQ